MLIGLESTVQASISKHNGSLNFPLRKADNVVTPRVKISSSSVLYSSAWMQMSDLLDHFSYIRGVEIAPPLPSPLFIMDDCTEPQNNLSWRGPTRISKPNSLVNSLCRDQPHSLGTVSTVL